MRSEKQRKSKQPRRMGPQSFAAGSWRDVPEPPVSLCVSPAPPLHLSPRMIVISMGNISRRGISFKVQLVLVMALPFLTKQ